MKKETAVNIVGGALMIGATTFVVREILRDDSRGHDLASDQSALVNLDSNIKELLLSKTPDEIEAIKSRYFYVIGTLRAFYGQQISADGTMVGSILDSEMEARFNEEARNSIILGAAIAEYYQRDRVKLDQEAKLISLDDNTKLDIDDPLDLSIAAAFIESIFPDEDRDLQILYSSTSENLDKEIKDLKWLAGADVNIQIDSDSFAVLPKGYMVKLSRILQEIELNNIPFPKKIKFKNFDKDPGGGYYHNSKATEPFTIVITNYSDEDTSVHEVGHFVSDANRLENQDKLVPYGQGAFEQMIKTIQEKYSIQGSITEQENLVEEYANKFTMYFLRGDSFRSSIINSTSEVERDTLRQEYEFFKSLFNNREFRYDGVLVEQLNENEIKIGHVIEITDTDTEKPGIFLRPSPTLDIEASYPVVWDEDEVKILEGPSYFTDENGKIFEMWKVRAGTYFYDRFYEQRDENQEFIEGWISREWFGRIISED